MWRPDLWWRGLLPLALIVLLTALMGTSSVERDLAQRAAAALAQGRGAIDGKPWSVPVVTGRDVLLGGQAPDSTALDLAQGNVASVWGVRRVSATGGLIPEQSPYRFSATMRDGRIVLGGSVPPDGGRTRLVAAASEGGQAPVDDQLRYARGAPAGFEGAAAIALRQLRRLVSGETTVEGTSLTFVGVASNAQVAQEVTAALRTLPAGFKPARIEVYSPPPDPYVFAAAFADDNLTLGGFLPDPAARDTLLAVARSTFPEAKLADGIALARGTVGGVDTARAAAFVLELLSGLSPGKVSISADQLTISGDARDAAAFARVRQSLSGILPGGLRLGSVDVRPPPIKPYRLDVRRMEGALTLEGHFPDEASASAIRERIRGQFLGDRVTDTTARGRGAPAGFSEVALLAVDQLARLVRGRVLLEDSTLSVQGEVLHAQAAEAVRRTLASLPAGWSLSANALTVAPPGPPLSAAACQTELVQLMGRGSLVFETGSARIYRASYGLLDNLVYLLQRCPAASVSISGHTDSDGSPERNLELSGRRATAVADYLRDAGIPSERLTATGYGATRPLAPNDSDANKARNRRIEFQVAQ